MIEHPALPVNSYSTPLIRSILGDARRRARGKNCYDLQMSLISRLLASGPGWHVEDVICNHGPADRPFEERHEAACIAVVSAGTFYYRSAQGAALLVPGALLLGNPGTSFECGHERTRGDRCLAFHRTPEFMEDVAAQIPGARTAFFGTPRLPPLRSLMPVVAAAEAARDGGHTAWLEELAVHFVAEVLKLQSASRRAPTPSARDTGRVWTVVHWIEAHAHDSVTLSQLARMASMSRYHFLRTFRAVAGATPYQYLLALRLRRASAELARSSSPISTVAYSAGFGDLSTFNRQFRCLAKMTPREYRQSVRRYPE